MKKFISTVIIIILAFLLVSCQDKKNNVPFSLQDLEKLAEGTDYTGQKFGEKISRAWPFSDGVAFIEGTSRKNMLYCIDTEGIVLFQTNKLYIERSDSGVGFHNGITVVKDTNYNFAICDKKGKLHYAGEFGATKILSDWDMLTKSHDYFGNDAVERAFKDGYVFLENRNSTYQGTSMAIMVINSSLNVICDALPDCNDINDIIDYHNGYVFLNNGIIFNLNSNKIETDQPILENLNVYLSNGEILYDITDEKVMDVSQYSTMTKIIYKKGKILAIFENGINYYFSILNNDGTLAFQPILYQNGGFGHEIEFNGDIILTNSDGAKTFDCSGKLLGETFESNASLSMDDNLVCAQGKYFDKYLNLLFQE